MDDRISHPKENQKLREEATANALIQCEEQREKLKQCLRTSWFGWCGQTQKDFWACFSKVS